MEYNDKYHLTKDQNRRFARMNFTRLVHTNARFEGINTTLPQTQTIMDGMGVDGVDIDDINTIVQIKRGWQLITESDKSLSLEFEKNINKIVAKNDALVPGEFRSGQDTVDIGLDEDLVPDMVDISKEEKYLNQLMESNLSVTEKSIRVMYHNMRGQLFWDGNKRTATLIANKLMIDNGAGLINVPLNLWTQWNKLITDYYQTNKVDDLLKWTYTNAIQGIDIK
ncbi:Fic family protein [Companilactobacillus halodurans]|uniref:Filamentation induced by cAMP protein fic n=1 Tax=Companilactobacillus halodurans TaxID=2584183 RepID=A0A5P0ZMU0_9LACO|nr:Fic family protein [Companilactobacillus halodurans]MQS75537.1 filamentation induced by cAMP protein fic [Companilactobacillus halodurans]MQS97781.1 filamentation induced by cAMP protein fic [Companilactobacillus halodurans]